MACTQPGSRICRRFAFSGGYSGQILKGMDGIYLLSFTLQVSQRKVGSLAIKSVGWQWHYKLEDSWVSTVLWKRFFLKWFLPPVSSLNNSHSFQWQRHHNRNIILKKKKNKKKIDTELSQAIDNHWLLLTDVHQQISLQKRCVLNPNSIVNPEFSYLTRDSQSNPDHLQLNFLQREGKKANWECQDKEEVDLSFCFWSQC